MDLFNKCRQFTDAKEAIAAGYYPYFHALESGQDTEVIMDSRRVIMIGSNNYMGLTSDPRTIKAAKDALDKYGTGCSGSRFLNGTLVLHEELERELADFFGKESALTFSTGFQTNLGIISCIVDGHDYIINDSENHASIRDACRLSFAKKVVKFEHNNMENLERVLKRLPESSGKLIIIDGVFSMTGDIADLPEIVRLAKQYDAHIMVDDAHGVGMIGDGGRGTASYYDLVDEVDIIMTTFSKSLASLGGCITASEEIIHYVKHKSRPFIFSASLTPANTAVALEALRIIKKEPWRVKALQDISQYMRSELKKADIPIMDGTTAIIPILTFDTIRTCIITKRLLEEGVYVNPVVPPAVPEGQCLLRTSYTATHTKEQMDFAICAIKKVFDEVKI